MTSARGLLKTGIAIVLCAADFDWTCVRSAWAQEVAQKTTFTLNDPLEIPGTILDAGKYVIKRIESATHRNVLEMYETVQILNSDETKLIATLLTLPHFDIPTTDKTVFAFFERTGNAPPKALRLWFCPGEKHAEEFVYPKVQAVELADAVNRPVLSIPLELSTSLPSSKITAETPPLWPPRQDLPAKHAPTNARTTTILNGPNRDQKSTQPFTARMLSREEPKPHVLAPDNQATKSVQDAARNRARHPEKEITEVPVKVLPKTASYLPVLAVLGVLSLLMAFLLRILVWRLEKAASGVIVSAPEGLEEIPSDICVSESPKLPLTDDGDRVDWIIPTQALRRTGLSKLTLPCNPIYVSLTVALLVVTAAKFQSALKEMSQKDLTI